MRRQDIAVAALGCAALVVAVFAVGGSVRWAQAVVAGLVALALIPLITSRRTLGRMSPLIALFATAAALCAIQLIPLPDSLLELLQPTGAALRRDGAELAGTSPSSTLSLDVPGTLRALAGFITLLGLAVVALRLAVSARGRYHMVAVVAACCGGGAIVVGVHELFDLRDLYGLYELDNVQPHLLGPLLNQNHLGGLMAMGTIVSLGLVAHRRQRTWLRAMWLVNSAACATVCVVTVSRGATLALIAGAIVTGGILVAQRLFGHESPRRRRMNFLTSSLPIGIVGVCCVLIVVFSNAGSVMSQLSHTSFDELGDSRTKFAAWRSSIALVEESPVLGVGRGAFETSFTRVHPGSSQATFSHVENEYLQVVIDWGVVGGILMLLAMTWLATRAIRRWREDAVTAGVLGALCAVAVQSTVDFGIEILGLAAPATVLLATVSQVPLRETTTRGAAMLARAVRGLHIVALGACTALLLSSVTVGIDEDHDRIRESPGDATTLAALERHPLDYYAFAVAADRLDSANDPRAIRLLNHAMALHPTHPWLHRAAARMLVRAGYPAQAAIEFGTALRFGPNQPGLIEEIATALPPEHALAALPLAGRTPQQVLRVLEELKRTDLAMAYLRRLLLRPASRGHACELLFPIAISGRHDGAELVLRHCMTPPPDYVIRVDLAKALGRQQAHDEAVKLLDDVETWQSGDRLTAWKLLCDSYIALKRWDDAKRCLRRLDIAPDGTAVEHDHVQKRLLDLDLARSNATVGEPSR